MIALIIVVFIVAIAVSTAIFAISLFLLEDIRASSFKELGVGPTLARCTGIVTVATLISLIPYGWIAATIVWFIGIMMLFQKTFMQTLVLTILNNIIGWGVAGALQHFLSSFQ